jgi:NTP pyrophosphatase (non-canonical NTP hydrolase)
MDVRYLTKNNKRREIMEFNEYQEACKRTANFEGTPHECISNVCMGIAGEAGELIDYIKKYLYQGKPLDEYKIKVETGDLLWYIAILAVMFNLDLNEIAKLNIHKLDLRYPNGFDKERSNNRNE